MKRIFLIIWFLTLHSVVFSQPYTFETVVTGLRNATSFVFLPNGNIIVNQQQDSSKVFSLNNQFLSCFWNFKDSCHSLTEAGLMGVCLDPNYSSNKFIYFYYVHSIPRITHRVVRLTDSNGIGTSPAIIFSDTLGPTTNNHYAGNMRFGRDGKLYVSIGDNGYSSNSQSLTTYKGKILRLNPNGSIPTDNPYYDDGNPKTGNDDRIWVLGLRNSFDLTFSPFNDSLYATENSASANDEVNFIRKGKNYGWPVCEGYCNPFNPLYTQPLDTMWGPGGTNFAPTGILIYNGNQMPELYGKMLISCIGAGIYSGLLRYDLGNAPNYDTIIGQQIISNIKGLTLAQGADGYIYLLQRNALVKMRYTNIGINDPSLPLSFSLWQNYPNPFNPATNIKYSIGASSFVSLKVYDVMGREVSTLVHSYHHGGNYEAVWDASEFPSGIYFYRLITSEFSEEKKMVLIK